MQDAISLLATLPAGLLAALVVEATHLIGADLILQAMGGEEGLPHPHPFIGEADLTLLRDLHRLLIVTTGDARDHTHLTTGEETGPGPDPTRLTIEHRTDHLTTDGGTGPDPGHTRLATEHVTDHTHPTTEEETGPIHLTTKGETGPTHLKVVTTEGIVAGQYKNRSTETA